MLEIKKLNTGYGKKQVIYDVSLHVKKNEIVAIIGPNGSGKSTLLKAISGVLPIWQGDIVFNGNSIKGNRTARNIKMGLTYCPQGNRVFTDMTVLENLEIGGFLLPKQQYKERLEAVLNSFPALKSRLKQDAGTLSGGERQMLALARALIPETNLLLLDEPSLGLAPNLLKDVFKKLVEIRSKMNMSILIVEQKVMEILYIVNRVYSVKLGRVAFDGLPQHLIDNRGKLKELFL